MEDTSCEPMEIDLSSNSVSAMDISYNEQATSFKEDNETDTKSKPTPRLSSSFKKLVVNLSVKNSNSTNNTLYYILGVIVLLLSGAVYYTTFKCKRSLNVEEIEYKLGHRIYGQSAANSKIINALRSQEKNKILILYGRTGVGKTLSVSIILEDVTTYSNIYHYTMPTFVDIFTSDLLLGLTLCQNSLIVIDDLKSNDTILVKDKLLNLLAKSKTLNKDLTIILVYNCDGIEGQLLDECLHSIKTKMKNSFNDNDILQEFIEYSQLDESTLKKCVEYEIGNRKISDDKLKYILKHFNVSQDGCKSVHQKMKYLNVL